jgi:hypothetical protein
MYTQPGASPQTHAASKTDMSALEAVRTTLILLTVGVFHKCHVGLSRPTAFLDFKTSKHARTSKDVIYFDVKSSPYVTQGEKKFRTSSP